LKLFISLFFFLSLISFKNQTWAKSKKRPAKITLEDIKPGPGDIMSVIQSHHAKLYYAGSEENWDLAQYELGEIQEGLESVTKLHPHFQDVKTPLAQLVSSLIHPQIEEVQKAIQAKNHNHFQKSFENLTHSCNKCHQAVEHSFIVIQVPTTQTFPNQKFSK